MPKAGQATRGEGARWREWSDSGSEKDDRRSTTLDAFKMRADMYDESNFLLLISSCIAQFSLVLHFVTAC